ncbi:MAG: NADPH:quinone reductase, partial [Pseudomonadota bacterium]
MRAICYDRFGATSDVLSVETLECPTPAAGEVRVALRFSGVNPSDAKARAGARPGVTKPPFPRIIPHSDGSGVIDAVGDGVNTSRLGQRVWIYNGAWQRPFGTAAEAITLPEDQAVPLPDDVSDEVGATLGIPGLTAAQTVFGGGDVAGQTLLISGGAGAVGHNAVQLAAWGGAHVIATCGPGAMDTVRRAGATHAFDYADPELAAKILDATGERGIDRAIEVEFGQNAPLLAQVMRPLGTIATYGSGKDMAPTLP